MKKIFAILMTLMLISSCNSDDNPIFSDNSTIRIKKSIEKLQQILLSSQNGWILQYYPNINKYQYANINQNLYTDDLSYIRLKGQEGFGYGGYSFLIKFNQDNKLIIQSDFNLNENAVSGEYNIIHNNGIELTFLTKNPIHNLIVNGFNGSANFIIKKIEKDQIILSTIKNIGQEVEYIVLKKMPPNIAWQDYLNEISKIKNEFEKMNFPVLEIKNPEQQTIFLSNYYPKNPENQSPFFINTYKRYILFVEDKDPNEYLSKFLVGVGSGYSFNNNEIVFKNGFTLNNDIVFKSFKRETEKIFKSEKNGYVAYIKEK